MPNTDVEYRGRRREVTAQERKAARRLKRPAPTGCEVELVLDASMTRAVVALGNAPGFEGPYDWGHAWRTDAGDECRRRLAAALLVDALPRMGLSHKLVTLELVNQLEENLVRPAMRGSAWEMSFEVLANRINEALQALLGG